MVNVDLVNGTIRVALRKWEGEEDSPKTGKARDVKLTPSALAAIKSQRAHTQFKGDKVFCHPELDAPFFDYRPLSESHWPNVLRALGMRFRAMYHTRHTCASLALLARVSKTRGGWLASRSTRIFSKAARIAASW